MSETDLQLLSRYTQQRAEGAFDELVRRHMGLVFSAALRQVRSQELAKEVAQTVFTTLARQGHRLGPNTILVAWLYQITRRAAIDVIRSEARRRTREQIALEINAMDSTSADWTQVEPTLDEAMESLDEKDRAAILLRYFDGKSLRDVGQALGASEDAARKRVDRAVEKLRAFFSKRGVSIGASGLATIIAANAVQAAPVGLATTVSAAALLSSATTSGVITSTVIMTTLQKTLVAAVVIVSGAGLYEAHQTSALRKQNQQLQQAQSAMTEEMQQLQSLHSDATNRLATAMAEITWSNRQQANYPKATSSVDTADPFAVETAAWAQRANSIKQWFKENPDKSIPELQLLDNEVWLLTARKNLMTVTPAVMSDGTTNGINGNTMQMIANDLRKIAKREFANVMDHALTLYITNNAGALPASLTDLLPYTSPEKRLNDTVEQIGRIDQSMLDRYRIMYAGSIADVPKDAPIIVETGVVDPQMDTLLKIYAGAYALECVGLRDAMLGKTPWSGEDLQKLEPFLRK